MPVYKATNNIAYTRLASPDLAYTILVWITLYI